MTLNMTFDDEEQAVHDGPAPKETITLPHKDISKQEKAWESSKTDRTDEPITTQDVAGTASVGKPTPLPDRALVVPELKKFLAERKPPEENPIVAQAQKIEQALHQIQQPAQPIATFEEQMMAKMEALEQRDYERQQREAEVNSQAEYDRKMADFKSNIVSNIESRPVFHKPGI